MNDIKQIEISYNEQNYNIEYFERSGTGPTILFLHGLGGAKENFEWATKHKALSNYTIIAFDNPGTGNSSYFPEHRLNLDDLTEITNLFICHVLKEDFFLAGASMGGLTLIKYMEKFTKNKVLGLINIEGNLMIEDCMFSSKVIKYDYETFINKGFQDGILEMRQNPTCGYHTIANNIALNTDPTSYYDYSFQTVEYSVSGRLFDTFVEFNRPKLFLHGDKNRTLSYLPKLRQTEVLVKEVSGSDHFLFYDNPNELYSIISEFIKKNDINA